MQQTLDILKKQYESTEDFMEKMEILSQIDDIEMELGVKTIPKPADSPYFCEGCGS